MELDCKVLAHHGSPALAPSPVPQHSVGAQEVFENVVNVFLTGLNSSKSFFLWSLENAIKPINNPTSISY